MILNKDNFKQEVEENANIVLVDFFATWCGPCQIMSPVIDEIIKENKDQKVKIGKLNIDDDHDIATKHGVMSIPTFILFKGGKAVSRIIGYSAKEDLLKMIEKNK